MRTAVGLGCVGSPYGHVARGFRVAGNDWSRDTRIAVFPFLQHFGGDRGWIALDADSLVYVVARHGSSLEHRDGVRLYSTLDTESFAFGNRSTLFLCQSSSILGKVWDDVVAGKAVGATRETRHLDSIFLLLRDCTPCLLFRVIGLLESGRPSNVVVENPQLLSCFLFRCFARFLLCGL